MAILRVDAERPEPAIIEEAAAWIRAGRLVAFPTETVYGLGAAALDSEAVARIYAAKGRPSYNPLIVHVLDAVAARERVRRWPELATALTRRFWPGPLTLVLAKGPEIPELVTAGLDTVALRAPAHPVARALLAAAAVPIAAPSANRSQGISPTTAAHVARSLGEREDLLILDGGPTAVGIESTVIDLSGPRPTLLRLGGLERRELEALCGPLAEPPVGGAGAASEVEAPRASPGMLDRHYAPAGVVELVDAAELVAPAPGPGPTGALVIAAPAVAVDHPLRMPGDAREYGRTLYAALHTLDELGCARIFVERVPEDPAWAAVRDRLQRASR